MSKREKPITAAELDKELRRDPEYMAWRRTVDVSDKAAQKAERLATRALRKELAAVGVRVRSVWDLVNTGEPYPTGIPVLIRHLSLPYDDPTKEAIARALTVREARGIAAEALIEEFKRLPAPETTLGPKWAIGNALAMVATKEHIEELLELALDKRHGPARSQLPRALGKFRTPAVKAALEQLLTDPDTAVEAERALRKFK